MSAESWSTVAECRALASCNRFADDDVVVEGAARGSNARNPVGRIRAPLPARLVDSQSVRRCDRALSPGDS